MATSKQLSVRMPCELVEWLSERGKSARYIVEAVREKVARDEEAEIAASLRCLANHDEASDISDLAEGQAKVIARGD